MLVLVVITFWAVSSMVPKDVLLNKEMINCLKQEGSRNVTKLIYNLLSGSSLPKVIYRKYRNDGGDANTLVS